MRAEREGKKMTKGSGQRKEGEEGYPKGKGGIARGRERNLREKEIDNKGRSWEKTLKMASPQL